MLTCRRHHHRRRRSYIGGWDPPNVSRRKRERESGAEKKRSSEAPFGGQTARGNPQKIRRLVFRIFCPGFPNFFPIVIFSLSPHAPPSPIDNRNLCIFPPPRYGYIIYGSMEYSYWNRPIAINFESPSTSQVMWYTLTHTCILYIYTHTYIYIRYKQGYGVTNYSRKTQTVIAD